MNLNGFVSFSQVQSLSASLGRLDATQGTFAETDTASVLQSSLLEMLYAGSWLGDLLVTLILLMALVSCYFIVINFLTITRRRLMPQGPLNEIERLLASGETKRAEEYGRKLTRPSLAVDVIVAGLERYHNHEFGFAEYRSACEEAGEDQTGRLYRRTEILNVIAAVAPMLGLAGTVLGMIEAFQAIASRSGIAQPQDLAGGIGEALITTLLGLFVAIPTMVALSFFRTKIDSLVSETGKRVERILLPLGRNARNAAQPTLGKGTH